MPTLSRRDWIACCSALAGAIAVPQEGRAIRRPRSVTPVMPVTPDPAILRLCFNENPHGPPPAAVRAASAALSRANRYADQEEFDALIVLIAEREGVTPAHLLLGTGSSELLGLAAVTFLHQGGELVTAHPAFPHLVDLAERIGARIRRVSLDLAGVHDLEAMAEAVGPDTRLINVCNPNNPTGTIVACDRLRAFCERVSGRAPVLVDQAYHKLVDAPEHATMVPLARDGAPVLVMRTFSKVYGMAGYRVGYAIAPLALIQRLRIRHIPSHPSFLWFESGENRRDLPAWLHARGVRIAGDVQPLTGDWARVSIGTAAEMRRFLRELRGVWASG